VHGLLFHGQELWYTTSGGVFAVTYHSGDRRAPTDTRMIADLSDPGAADRWTHTLAEAADGSIYVSRGQYDNETCPPPNRRGGAVLRIGPGHDRHGDVAITGLRNPLYTRCLPWGTCYAAELSGDGWTGIGGKEKLVEIRDGEDFGYPCCVDRNMPNPFVQPTPDCRGTGVAVESFPLHDTPFGFDWERGVWPAPYTGAFFVAQHGEVGSWRNTVVKWASADATTHRPSPSLTDFVSGFSLQGPVMGRPADLLFAPDGRMFLADDQGGAIYWIAPRTLLRP
jgi:glucose/arabinose dehydrogenase